MTERTLTNTHIFQLAKSILFTFFEALSNAEIGDFKQQNKSLASRFNQGREIEKLAKIRYKPDAFHAQRTITD